MTIALFGGLGLFIVFGLPKTDYVYVLKAENLFRNGTFAFISTLALLSSATAGAQFIAELVGETKDAGRTIPKVMVVSTFNELRFGGWTDKLRSVWKILSDLRQTVRRSVKTVCYLHFDNVTR